MSAPTSAAPLVVNTRDGMCWTRRTVTSSGIALYAPEGVCACPEFVMATLSELAERGISGSADVLPVPVGPEPQGLDLAAIVSRALRVARQYDGPDGIDQDDLDRLTGLDVPQLVAAVRGGRIELEKARAEIANHGPVLAALERERARIAELEAAQGTAFRASHESMPMGYYESRKAAMDHVHAALAFEEGGDVTARVIWRADAPEADEPTWECWLFDADMADDKPTGYVVTPLEVASKYDEEADA